MNVLRRIFDVSACVVFSQNPLLFRLQVIHVFEIDIFPIDETRSDAKGELACQQVGLKQRMRSDVHLESLWAASSTSSDHHEALEFDNAVKARKRPKESELRRKTRTQIRGGKREAVSSATHGI